jgi:hypothetical protein
MINLQLNSNIHNYEVSFESNFEFFKELTSLEKSICY